MPVDVAGVGIFDLDARTCAPALDSLKGVSRQKGMDEYRVTIQLVQKLPLTLI